MPPRHKKLYGAKAKEVAKDIKGKSYIYVTENEKGGEALARTEYLLASKYGFDGLKTRDKSIGRKHLGYDTRYGTFYVGYNSFLQGNRHIANHLQDFVFENAEGRLGLELYCGSGYLTLPMARKCEKIDAIESYAPPSIRLAERAKLKNVKWHISQSEQVMSMGKRKIDVVVADPPRTGMEKEVCKFIKESGAQKKSSIYLVIQTLLLGTYPDFLTATKLKSCRYATCSQAHIMWRPWLY